jgi:hypothetical protein
MPSMRGKRNPSTGQLSSSGPEGVRAEPQTGQANALKGSGSVEGFNEDIQ